MSVLLRKANENDLPQIAELEAVTFESVWNMQMLSDSLNNEYDCINVAVDSETDVIVGYIIYNMPNENGELYRIAVAENARRQGIARMLLEEMINSNATKNTEKIFLEVREGNDAVITLYKSFGFEEISRRKKYYQATGEDALIMCLELKNNA